MPNIVSSFLNSALAKKLVFAFSSGDKVCAEGRDGGGSPGNCLPHLMFFIPDTVLPVGCQMVASSAAFMICVRRSMKPNFRSFTLPTNESLVSKTLRTLKRLPSPIPSAPYVPAMPDTTASSPSAPSVGLSEPVMTRIVVRPPGKADLPAIRAAFATCFSEYVPFSLSYTLDLPDDRLAFCQLKWVGVTSTWIATRISGLCLDRKPRRFVRLSTSPSSLNVRIGR